MTRRHAALVVLVVFAAVVRFWGLAEAPPALHPDEATVALEARYFAGIGPGIAQANYYEVRTDRTWPLVFVMHGKYWVEGTYLWLAIPCMKLPIPLEAAVRVPAALAGVLLVPLVYLLGRRLLGGRAALAAAVLICVQPYAVHYSRLGLRATLIPTLLSAGLLLGLAAAARPEKDRRGLALAVGGGLFLCLALVTYTPARAFVPLLLVAFSGLGFVRFLSPRWFLLVIPPATGFVLALPWLIYGEGAARMDAVAAASVWEVVSGYALHYSPRMLFWGSSSKGFWAENVSPLLWVEAPLLVLGLLSLGRRALGGAKNARLLLAWFFLFPVASALTVPAPNPMRAIFALPLLALVSAEGYRFGCALARRRAGRRGPRVVTGAALLAGAVGVVLAGQSYFVRFPKEEGRFWYVPHANAIKQVFAAGRERGANVSIHCGDEPMTRNLVRLYAGDDWYSPAGYVAFFDPHATPPPRFLIASLYNRKVFVDEGHERILTLPLD